MRAACVSLLKLALETAIQRAYYKLLGVSDEEALARISRRSRGYASFTASMVKGLKGVHASRRRWVLKVYLHLAELTHPSMKLHKASTTLPPTMDLVVEALDVIAYLEALTGVDVGLDLASTCRLERTRKLLERRGS